MKKSLYFLAIIPPEDISIIVTALKTEAKTKFGSKHALKSPPHITIVPPFWLAEDQLLGLEAVITDSVKSQEIFSLNLNGFSCFTPRVIYISNSLSNELANFQQNIFRKSALFHNKSLKKNRLFTPHMTVAFKDLDPGKFAAAWDYFSAKSIDLRFQVEGLYLLKHQAKRWQITKSFEFQSE
jgi:2'-5' RNA ligase